MSKLERIWHPWNKWECYRAGFFHGDLTKIEEWRESYVRLLSDLDLFESTLQKVLAEWTHSCEHNLTNESMNRIAWLGQASCAYVFGACAHQTRSAFKLLTEEQQASANAMAEKYLNIWLENHTRVRSKEVPCDENGLPSCL